MALNKCKELIFGILYYHHTFVYGITLVHLLFINLLSFQS